MITQLPVIPVRACLGSVLLGCFLALGGTACEGRPADGVVIRLDSAKGSPDKIVAIENVSDDAIARLQKLAPSQLREHLQVFVKSAFEQDQSPAVFGEVLVNEKTLTFRPRFPLQAGVVYLVRFREESQKPWQTQELEIAKKKLESTTRVTEVFPTSSQLPQNLLKFYVYFSAPMTQGEAYEHIELLGADGKPVPFPFLEIAEELWDKSGQRLTLLLDPARVKRGLVPREEDGPILNNGSRYRLIIKPTWPDARGVELAKGFVKSFTVGPEDFRQPDPATWQFKTPKSKSRDRLTIVMPEPMDHATFARGVTIENDKGQVVLGDFTFSHNETQAHFTPLKDWRPGLYDVRILKRIEDLAGNSIDRPFELDKFDTVASSPNDRATITIEIE